MGWFLAATYEWMMRPTEEACLHAWRAELLGGLTGTVLEIGAGTGLNAALYPPSVTRLVLTEPDAAMRKRLTARVAGDPRVEVNEAAAEHLPWPDDSFDAVASTLVLCSVADPAAAAAEIHRVLRPGGVLVFLEHVAADDQPGRLKWQRRLEPLWKRAFGGCHLTRHTAETLAAAGFVLEDLERESLRKAMPVVRPSIRGRARKRVA